MRTGLVLGAGGVVGASWLIGALDAVASETGWDPAEAEFIVGTSAGAVVGALTAVGISPPQMAAYLSGDALEDVADTADQRGELAAMLEASSQARLDGAHYTPARALPPIGPGSWRMAVNTLLHPRQHTPATLLSGWLPRGFMSTRPISRLVETFVPGDWPEHPGFRAVAADYATGDRVAFGASDAPPAGVGEAVAASCAIPGFYQPVSIGGRKYVDGGICSMSNLDMLRKADLDLVICLNPTSSLAEAASWSPSERIGAALRAVSGRRVGHEARKLRETGTHVVLLQPTAEDIGVMGLNFMARGRRAPVTQQAIESTTSQLRKLRDQPDVLLPGTRRRRRSTAAKTSRAAKAA